MRIILLLLTLSSCATTYKIKKCAVTDGIQHCSTAEIKSRREFPEGMQLTYNSKTGDFEFYADKVETKVSPVETVTAQFLADALKTIQLGKGQ